MIYIQSQAAPGTFAYSKGLTPVNQMKGLGEKIGKRFKFLYTQSSKAIKVSS